MIKFAGYVDAFKNLTGLGGRMYNSRWDNEDFSRGYRNGFIPCVKNAAAFDINIDFVIFMFVGRLIRFFVLQRQNAINRVY